MTDELTGLPLADEVISRRLAAADPSYSGLLPSRSVRFKRRLKAALSWLPGISESEEPYVQLVREGRLQMGPMSYHAPIVHTFAGDPTRVVIGNYCSIGPGVAFIAGGNHPTDTVSSYPLRVMYGLPGGLDDEVRSKGDIAVGNDVWIGREAKIVSGVTIGDGAVVAAFSVVTHDVEPYTIVAGVPAQLKRRRFDEATAAALLRIAWWDWPPELIIERVDDLMSNQVASFIDKYDDRCSRDAARSV